MWKTSLVCIWKHLKPQKRKRRRRRGRRRRGTRSFPRQRTSFFPPSRKRVKPPSPPRPRRWQRGGDLLPLHHLLAVVGVICHMGPLPPPPPLVEGNNISPTSARQVGPAALHHPPLPPRGKVETDHTAATKNTPSHILPPARKKGKMARLPPFPLLYGLLCPPPPHYRPLRSPTRSTLATTRLLEINGNAPRHRLRRPRRRWQRRARPRPPPYRSLLFPHWPRYLRRIAVAAIRPRRRST